MRPTFKPPRLAGFFLTLAGGLFSVITLAQPALTQTARIDVTDLKPLLTQAISLGSAHGRLIGPGAEYIQRRFGSSEPIEVDVQRLRQEAQSGCARLRVTTRQRGLSGPPSDSSRSEAGELAYQISFCSNGQLTEAQN